MKRKPNHRFQVMSRGCAEHEAQRCTYYRATDNATNRQMKSTMTTVYAVDEWGEKTGRGSLNIEGDYSQLELVAILRRQGVI